LESRHRVAIRERPAAANKTELMLLKINERENGTTIDNSPAAELDVSQSLVDSCLRLAGIV
jgi:hypothetical protein